MLEVGVTRMHGELITPARTPEGTGPRTARTCSTISSSPPTSLGMLAAELQVDADEAKRAAFLHDIGKAVSHEVGGSHALIGAEIARRFGEDPGVVHAIEAHHNEVEPRTLTAIIVQAADAVSAARPGARREALESVCTQVGGAGVELASLVSRESTGCLRCRREERSASWSTPASVDDLASAELSSHAASLGASKKIYSIPGQIEVTVIREYRAKDYAR